MTLYANYYPSFSFTLQLVLLVISFTCLIDCKDTKTGQVSHEMSHSSRPAAATSLTVAHCTKPEFQVEEECWGKKRQGLPRMPKKLLGEQGHLESRLPRTSFSRLEFMGLHLIPNRDKIYLHPICSFPNWCCDFTHGHLLKGKDK